MAPTEEKMEELACRPQLGDVSVGRRTTSRYQKWYSDHRAHRPQLCKGSMILSCLKAGVVARTGGRWRASCTFTANTHKGQLHGNHGVCEDC